MIHHTAIIYDNVDVGNNVVIGAYSVIGSPAESKGADNVNPKGKVVIGDGTVIREHVTIHSPVSDEGVTSVGKECYIQAHSHIGHDSKIGDFVTIACYACIGGHSILEDHVNIALHAVTHQRTTVKTGTIVGACGFVKGVIDGWGVYVGVPAKRIKDNTYLMDKLGLTK